MATKKITQKQLAEAVEKIVKINLKESNHFTAMRSIEHAADTTSMEFERNIVDTLGLRDQYHLQPDVQAKFFQIVTKMKQGIRAAIMDAAKELVPFPKAEQAIKGGSK